MAKKNGSKSKGNTPSSPAAKSAAVAKTAPTTKLSGSAPKAQTISKAQAKLSAPRKVITTEQIARRAYEIYASGKGGTETENWHRAERDLREGRA